MIKVSVIMPVLNGMPYFNQALDSVRTQSLQEIEILVVDAGSNDGTVEYTKKVMAEDRRVKLIESDMKSHGRQCNLGMDVAMGEYIGFCESDDFLEPTMYEDLAALGEKNPQVEVIVSECFMMFGEGENQINYHHSLLSSKNQHKYLQPVTYEDLPELQHGLQYMWHSIYNTAFLKDNEIRLNETKGASFQDAGFVEHMKLRATYFLFTPKAYYHYRRDNSNSSNFKKGLGAFGIWELTYALQYHLQKYPLNERSVKVFFKHFQMFLHYYKLEKSFYPESEYTEEVQQLQGLLSDFWEKCPVSLRLSYSDSLLDVFLSDLNTFHGILAIENAEKKKKLDLILGEIATCDTVVIFGFGESGRNYQALLKKKYPELTVICCDNNEKLRVNGVLSTSDVVKQYPQALYLQTVESAFVPMRAQLVSLGVENNQILKVPLLSQQEAVADMF